VFIVLATEAAVVVIPDVLTLPQTYLLSEVYRNSLCTVFFANALFNVFGLPENLERRLLAEVITVAADAGCCY